MRRGGDDVVYAAVMMTQRWVKLGLYWDREQNDYSVFGRARLAAPSRARSEGVMRSTRLISGLALLLALAACADESPVEFENLLPGGGIHTAETTFDAAAFIEWDSVRTGYLRPRDADFFVVAKGYEDSLDVNGLMRFTSPPRSITYQDSTGKLVVDSIPVRIGGRLILTVDTLRVRGATENQIELSLYDVAEDWDAGSANWTMRVDSGGVRLPWSVPGGTPLRLIDTAFLVAGDTTVEFVVDSAGLAFLSDSTTRDRGLLIRAETAGTLVEFTSARLRFNVRPTARPDTLFTDSIFLNAKTFLPSHDPDPTLDPSAPLYIGGMPSVRTYVRFKEGIDTLQVPCPDGPSGCTISLRDVVINYAGLAFTPVPAAPGYNVPDTIPIEVRTVLSFPGVPLSRIPLGIQLSSSIKVPPVTSAEPGKRVEVPVTTLITALTSENESVRSDAPRTVALLGSPEGDRYGVVAFGSLASGIGLAPRIRLIYSVTKEVQVQ